MQSFIYSNHAWFDATYDGDATGFGKPWQKVDPAAKDQSKMKHYLFRQIYFQSNNTFTVVRNLGFKGAEHCISGRSVRKLVRDATNGKKYHIPESQRKNLLRIIGNCLGLTTEAHCLLSSPQGVVYKLPFVTRLCMLSYIVFVLYMSIEDANSSVENIRARPVQFMKEAFEVFVLFTAVLFGLIKLSSDDRKSIWNTLNGRRILTSDIDIRNAVWPRNVGIKALTHFCDSNAKWVSGTLVEVSSITTQLDF